MTERSMRWAILIGSVALSAGGIALAASGQIQIASGGRGGALAVAWSLAGFFLRNDLTQQLRAIFTAPDTFMPATVAQDEGTAVEKRIGRVENRVQAIEVAGTASVNSQRKMERFVAIATAIGTLSWGFGDWVAIQLR